MDRGESPLFVVDANLRRLPKRVRARKRYTGYDFACRADEVSRNSIPMWFDCCSHCFSSLFLQWMMNRFFTYKHENITCSTCPKGQHKHLTYDSMKKNHFWAYTWKQKLFSMTKGSTLSNWHMTARQTITLEPKKLWHSQRQTLLVPSCCQ